MHPRPLYVLHFPVKDRLPAMNPREYIFKQETSIWEGTTDPRDNELQEGGVVLVPPVPGTIANGRKTRRCVKAKGIRIIMIPASRRDADERKSLSREIERTIAEVRHHGGEVDPGLIRAKEAVDDEKNHLLIARSRWGELLGSLSYTFPDPVTIRIDYIGMKIHRCGIGTRLMVSVAELALQGNLKIRLIAEKGAKGFFERLGMEKLEEFTDGNCSFEFTGDGMRSLLERFRRSQ
jgi:hypothetical protein